MLRKFLIPFFLLIVAAIIIAGYFINSYLDKVKFYEPLQVKVVSEIPLTLENFCPYGISPKGRLFPFYSFNYNEFNHGYSYFSNIGIRTNENILFACRQITFTVGKRSVKYNGASLKKDWEIISCNQDGMRNELVLKAPANFYTKSSKLVILLSAFRWEVVARNLYIVIIILIICIFVAYRLIIRHYTLYPPEEVLMNRDASYVKEQNLRSSGSRANSLVRDLFLITDKKISFFTNSILLYFTNIIPSFFLRTDHTIRKFLLFTDKKIPYNYLTILFCIAALSPFIYLSFFTFPTPEEIQISANAAQSGLKYLNLTYNGKDGRVFTSFLYIISPLSWHSILGYRLMLLALMISLWGSFHFFLNTVFTQTIHKNKILLWSLLLIVLFTCLMPSVASGYYWLFAGITYIVPLILLLILLSILVRNGDNKLPVYKVFIICIFIIMICGSHEMYIPLITFILFLLMIFSFFCHSRNKWYFLGFFILSIAIAYLVIKAPGHTGRIQINHTGRKLLNLFGSGNVLRALSFSVQSVLESFYRYIILNPVILLLSILSFQVFYKLKPETGWAKKLLNIKPLWSISGFIIFMVLPVMPFFIVAENAYLYMDRLFNIICFILILFWFFNLLVIVAYFKKYKLFRRFFEIINRSSAAILFRWMIIIFFITYIFYPKNNIFTAYNDIFSGRASDYRRQMELRFATMSRPLNNIYNKHSLLIVEPVSVKPASIHYQDFDITGFNNMFREGVADYFHVNEVRYCTDTIPYHSPAFMNSIMESPDDSKSITMHKGCLVFGRELLPSFIKNLYGIDSLSGVWFIYKDFNFGYNMYDSTFNLNTRLWIAGDTGEFIPVMHTKFTNIKGDTAYTEILDSLKPKLHAPLEYCGYAKLKLNLSDVEDKCFVDAILENRITFVLTSLLNNQVIKKPQ